jgi:hypothetical protein
MRGAGVCVLLSAIGLALSANAADCCRNYQEFADRCRSQGGVPSQNPLKCSPKATSAPATSQPPSDNGRAQREAAAAAEAAAATAAAEAAAAAIEVQRKKEEAERQARFIRDRDAAVTTLRGSIGTSAAANSTGGAELRGSDTVAVGHQLRGAATQPDVGGRQAAWKQLHCAASILGPAIQALDLAGTGKSDYKEFRFLADEAANALNGQRLKVSCAPAPAMPPSLGRARDPVRQAEGEQQLVAKVRDLGTKLEDARRKQSEAQATLRGEAAANPGAPTSDVVEQQRRINRARDAAGNEMAKAQREFNEGKRSEESAKKELQKVQRVVENIEKGQDLDLTFNLAQDSAPRRRRDAKAE